MQTPSPHITSSTHQNIEIYKAEIENKPKNETDTQFKTRAQI